MLYSVQAWSAGSNVFPAEWLHMDAGAEIQMAGIAIRGRSDANQWVTRVRVYYLDGSTLTFVGSYAANSDRSSIVYAYFDTPAAV